MGTGALLDSAVLTLVLTALAPSRAKRRSSNDAIVRARLHTAADRGLPDRSHAGRARPVVQRI